jgi:hypothetical protein
MTTVNEGPASVMPIRRKNDDLKVTFRILTDYLPETDIVATRINLLINGKQFNVSFESGIGELKLPKSVDGFMCKANADDLVSALRGLVDTIEKQ